MPSGQQAAEPQSTDGIRVSHRGRLMASFVVVAVAAGAVGYISRTTTEDLGTVEAAPLSYAEVVTTDLFEETTYSGTLGRQSGDPIHAAGPGVITWLPVTGATVAQGEVIYAIDGQPVVLLYGDVPGFRDLSISADQVTVTSRMTGTITAISDAGASVEQGDVLYEIDGRPVVALYGDTPAYRTLSDQSTNLTGNDVLQLEQALDALGYVSEGEMTVDDVFTGATDRVVTEWQESIGAEEDGTVDLGEVVFVAGPTQVKDALVSVGDVVGPGHVLMSVYAGSAMSGDDVVQLRVALGALGYEVTGSTGPADVFTTELANAVKRFEVNSGLDVDGRITRAEVVFAPSAVRISGAMVSLGSNIASGAPVLAVTGEDTSVTLNLPAADQGTLEEGMTVDVELPDRTIVRGTVVSVATAATVVANETIFEVAIALNDIGSAAGLDEAPVDVIAITDSVRGVMAVPVAALLALVEGGYAVEVEQADGQTRLVAVDPGFFSNGFVEINSDGVAPGDRVVVP